MSFDSEALSSSGIGNGRQDALPTRSPLVDCMAFCQQLRLQGEYRATNYFPTHVCRDGLKELISTDTHLTSQTLRQLLATALEAYLIRSMANHHDGSSERYLQLFLSCAACVRDLCIFMAVKIEVGHRSLVLSGLEMPPSGLLHVECAAVLEAALSRASRACLPCFYGGVCGLAELPCVDLGLCGCMLRSLYVAIYYSNAHMMSILLRYGAEVRHQDSCRCDEPRRMHPLLRVYNSLASPSWQRVLVAGGCPQSADLIRCHQLAVLVMPVHDAELREACYAFARTVTPAAEYEELLRLKGSLQHMCRLTLRAALARRRAMPAGVEQLPLPKRLQRYILYEDGPGSV